MSRLLEWLDGRTGCKRLFKEALFENVPGGSRWRYVWGSTLTFALAIQFITGIFLWLGYSPSAQTAWESVFYIQYETTGGWLLRGIHHYAAQIMTVLLVLHLMQVLIDGAYKAPREINFWFGLILLQLVLALSLTGYLLPWDQKGFWATRVATGIAGITPVIGPQLQQLIVGGPEYGHLTLTRFLALHAGILPALIVVLLVGHIYLFRRHGLTAKEPKRGPDQAFWPDQVLKDAVACLAVLAAVLFLVLQPWLMGEKPLGSGLGAELGAPADPSEQYAAARPDWYFLFLFQLLKYFPGGAEIWGAMVIPGLAMGVLFAMPFIAQWKLGHWFNVGFASCLLAGAALLTWLAIAEDRSKADFQRAVAQANQEAERVKVLAEGPGGIPSAGAVTLLRSDPLTQGPKLFSRNCSGCHRYDGHDGTGAIPAEPASAADLKGFGSRTWLAGLLDPAQVAESNYFGATKFADGKMARFVKRDVAKFNDADRAKLRKVISAVSAEAGLASQAELDRMEAAEIEEGRALVRTDDMRCTECHAFRKPDEDATAPDLTGWGSRDWLVRFISNAAHESFYGKRNDRMPAFAEERILDDESIGLIADWLRGHWYTPVGTTTDQANARR